MLLFSQTPKRSVNGCPVCELLWVWDPVFVVSVAGVDVVSAIGGHVVEGADGVGFLEPVWKMDLRIV